MKKFALISIFVLLLQGCGDDNGNGSQTSSSSSDGSQSSSSSVSPDINGSDSLCPEGLPGVDCSL